MIVSALILFFAAAIATLYARRRQPQAVPEAKAFAIDQASKLALRLPFALIAARCLAELIPDDAVAAIIGAQSGVIGVVMAALAGGLLPGGPMVSFPLALVLAGEGAGTAQLVALISGWSVFALHRVISYEAPLMGWRFVALRMLASLPVPIVAGLLAMAALQVWGTVRFGM